MTLQDWLSMAERQLKAAGVSSARLDSLILLERAVGKDRAWLLAHLESELDPSISVVLSGELDRRLVHEPMAYIMGKSEFYGREFYVNQSVLQPRPESEAMIHLLKELAPLGSTIADIGTGSGALAITAVLETGCQAAAVDIDGACLAVAQRNATFHNVSLELIQGSLLEPFAAADSLFTPEALLVNLPYVPDKYPVNVAARHEPKLALYGGKDGLDLYRQMFGQLPQLSKQPKLILCEAMPPQHAALADIAKKVGYRLAKTTGYIQAFVPVD